MSLYVLDTDILSLLREGHTVVQQRVRAHNPAEMVVSVITVEEQLSGWYSRLRKARKPADIEWCYQRLGDTVNFLGGRKILNLSQAALARSAQLSALKLNVGKMDLKIAAIALENGGIVVTRNVRDFQRVPNLLVENWAA